MSFLSVLRGEATKLLSLRSTRWTLLALVLATVGFSTLASYNIAQMNVGELAGPQFDPTYASLFGLNFGQLAIAVLGVLTMTTEYASGAVRATFTAVPRRGLVVGAKALLVALVGLVAGLISAFVAYFVGMIFFDHYGTGTTLGQDHVLRAVVGGGLFIMASGLFGFALGALLRHTAGAISIAIAGLLVVPPLTDLLPGAWGSVVHRYFTSTAGREITSVTYHDGGLGPWFGYGVFTLWWLVLGLAGLYLVQRRDA